MLPERAAAIALLIPTIIYTVLPVLAHGDASSGPVVLSGARLGRGLALELLLSATIGVWLWRQGWRPHRTVTRPFGWGDLFRGLGLWMLLIPAVTAWALAFRAVFPELLAAAATTRIIGQPPMGIVVPFVLVNAVFEELLWLGLAFVAFQRLGSAGAGVLSAGLRLMIHAYQGPLALVTIAPIAILFTVYYIRTRRLWPVVVAHGIQDLLALGLMSFGVTGSRAL